MKQIMVMTRNEPGDLAALTSALAERDINIVDLDAQGMASRGVIVLTVDAYDKALGVLRDTGFKAVSEDALVIRVKDRPGALARIAVRFKAEQINLRSMHIIQRLPDYSLASIVTDDNERAAKLLQDVLVHSAEWKDDS